ncbi:MAG: hypothetical protein JWP41_2468 [Ramlibacter sp.]|nr:hypothetical protein [Ramlibacter sp.]
MANFARTNLTTLKKTASYYVMHIAVAWLVGYAVTGSLWMASTLSLLEPTVQAIAFFFHEKAWERVGKQRLMQLRSDSAQSAEPPTAGRARRRAGEDVDARRPGRRAGQAAASCGTRATRTASTPAHTAPAAPSAAPTHTPLHAGRTPRCA